MALGLKKTILYDNNIELEQVETYEFLLMELIALEMNDWIFTFCVRGIPK